MSSRILVDGNKSSGELVLEFVTAVREALHLGHDLEQAPA